jgi:hypothetical protein
MNPAGTAAASLGIRLRAGKAAVAVINPRREREATARSAKELDGFVMEYSTSISDITGLGCHCKSVVTLSV